ncbi:glycosyltransferase family 4 protein [Ideonella oryzae]|uniref:Glycosyltransferase family 4 protein n=1 Tax=Ideonella oryzae TaxID=2937441 RepID=A0ABT1BRQ9_9BURK|nr:glycosyltransferase family 4 protein [Ideonella oryzae]MCO5978910.1 glycosyltransferase family 4 protein [Ideonella oryzae]
MRIAYFVNQYPKVSHTFIRREIQALEALGLSVERIALRSPVEELVDPQDLVELGRTRLLLDAPMREFLWAMLTALPRWPAAWRLMARLAWRNRIPVAKLGIAFAEACLLKAWLQHGAVSHVHVHFGTNSALVMLLCRSLGGPGYSMTVHGPEEFDAPHALALTEKAKSARFVVAISSFGRSQLMRWLDPADWPKVQVVHCGLDSTYWARAKVPVPAGEPAQLVCVGRLSPEKGQILLLQALRKALDQGADLRVVLAGDGPMRPQLESDIRALNLADHVCITGWIGNTEVQDLLLASRALVSASFAEGLPVVMMEALALRRPVLGTCVAGIPELVEPGRSGWLVPAGDVEALAQAMLAVARMPVPELDAWGEHGFARARQQHAAETEAAKLAQLLKACVPPLERSTETLP